MTERERLEKLLKRLDRATASAFMAYVAAVKSDEFIRRVERMLRDGNFQDAIDAVDSHLKKFASVIGRNYTLVGNDSARAIQEQYGRRAPGISITFDPSHPRAAQQMRQQSLDLIREIADKEKTAVRTAMTEAFNSGQGPRGAARAYRDAVGLTEKQREAVNNYRRLLENGSTQALDRQLRDKRYDKTVERAALSDEPLSSDQIDRMVSAYERKYLKYRSEVIARTESTRTLAEANDEAFRQSMEDMGIEESEIERDWKWTHDKRTRDSHSHMRVKTVTGFNTPFISGAGNSLRYPGDPLAPAEDTIQCRCVIVNRIKRPSD